MKGTYETSNAFNLKLFDDDLICFLKRIKSEIIADLYHLLHLV